MAPKPLDPNLHFLADLADHAHKLIDEFHSLPASERERSMDLLAEVQLVLSEFRRLRPPEPFGSVRTFRTSRMVTARQSCEICGKPVDVGAADVARTMSSVYHLACLEGREPS